MAKRELHSRAIEMRLKGMSYSQIKKELGVSKSALSTWLRKYPLSEERLRELRVRSEVQIERCRETKARKKQARLDAVRERVSAELGPFSERDMHIAGLFLYWGEGSKTTSATTAISNTDPAVILFFMEWLALLGVSKDRLRIYIHLYSDMDVEEEMRYWERTLDMPRSAFRKPYIKLSKRSGLSYKQRFAHGTCNVLFENRDTSEYVLMCLEEIRSRFAADSMM